MYGLSMASSFSSSHVVSLRKINKFTMSELTNKKRVVAGFTNNQKKRSCHFNQNKKKFAAAEIKKKTVCRKEFKNKRTEVTEFTNKWNAMWKCSWTNEMRCGIFHERRKYVLPELINRRNLPWNFHEETYLAVVDADFSPELNFNFRPPSYSEKGPSTEETWRVVGVRDCASGHDTKASKGPAWNQTTFQVLHRRK